MMTTFSAHTGIGTLPIIWYGNDSQKRKYLPKLANGEWMGCFALTEASSGSDAMAGKLKAKLSDDGKFYILNGQKLYVTNGGWADVCTTFAKVDGKYTAFIVDRNCEGFVIGEEEKKLGIKGSSTVTLYFENCKVPVENVLGEVGQGGPIALNVLYTGRYKLGVTTVAGAKYTLNAAYDYAKEREQFSRSIIHFDMIKSKFAKMVTRTWEADSVNYMTSGSIDKAIAKLDKKSNDYYVKMQKIIEDHAIEASICKIVGSETLAFVADESIQILGGAGFIEEYGMATIYRDERINRIFEGTNEINRLLICGITLKKSILEELPIRDAITLREKDWFAFSLDSDNLNERIVEFCRSACLATLNMIILKYGQDFKNNQWIQEPFANMLCSLLIIDTILKRTKNIKDPDKLREHLELLELSLCEHYKSINKEMDIIVSEIYKDTDRTQIDKQVDGYKKQLHYTPNEIELMKKVVTTFYKHEKYYLD
jgi:alkylation response protein AidB-like acyl-CoA dehydrogenase